MKRFLFFFILLISFRACLICAEQPLSPAIQKMEAARGNWIGLKASVKLDFHTALGQSAGCAGTLAYHRLDERLLLKCSDENQNLLFIFSATDTDFRLYLPSHQTVYEGNIFDLEDSPDIHSHLRALDLYRALKPLSLPPSAQAESKEDGFIVRVFRKGQGQAMRELEMDGDGKVTAETYYGRDGKPVSRFLRKNFKTVPESDGKKNVFYFPEQIGIEDYRKTADGEPPSQTVLTFLKMDFLPDLSEENFAFSFPKNAKTVSISEQ